MRPPDWQSDDGSVALYLGDCLELLPELGDRSIEAAVTDPPYGVGFKYESHDDSPAGYSDWCGRWFSELQRVASGPVGISCGIANLSNWPQADWVLCWHKPAAMGRCAVGFNNWEPLLLYGKTRAGSVVDVFTACILPDDSVKDHPCPKPIGWACGAIERLTKPGDTVLDSFMGSGTTGVACVKTGRRFVGMEIEPKYFDLSVRRIEAELGRHPLFEPARQLELPT